MPTEPVATPGNRPIRFVRRGEIVSLSNVPPSRTLLDLLREDLACTGTKEGCGEGDCGACTVVLGEEDHGTVRYRAVNSCIRLAHSIDGMALWTVEDIAGAGGALHPAQEAMVQAHGSQCGFCTPGFVMSLFGMYNNHVSKGEPVTRALAVEELSGNLCRCTGYRPILDAAQAMGALPAAPIDETALLSKLQLLAHDLPGLEADLASKMAYQAPRTLSALLHMRAAHPAAQLVAGCTDVGLWVTKQHLQFEHVIDVTKVQELRCIEDYPQHLAIGAAVTLVDAYATLVAQWPQLHAFATRFAGLPVRNSGTLGGNVANGSPIGDSMPLLIAMGANVVLMSIRGHREMPLEQLYTGYRTNVMTPDEVLAWIKVPKPGQDESLQVYKISKRFDDDISAVCLAINLQIKNSVVTGASIGVGGVAATPVRATKTEAALTDQPWTAATVQRAIGSLQAEFSPISDMRASGDYRREVLGNLLQRYWLESQGVQQINLQAFKLEGSVMNAPGDRRDVSVSRDAVDDPQVNAANAQATSPATPEPVASPTPPAQAAGTSRFHESARAQVSGSATYVDDIPEIRGTLFAAPILSTVAHGRLLGVDTTAARAMSGVRDVILASDIPGDPLLGNFAHDEPVFAKATVQHVGQVIGLVIAESVMQARRAARKVVCRTEALPAILNVRDAMKAESYVLPPVFVRRGDAAAALATAVHTLHGTLEVGGQEHFYLEGQVAYVVPQEQDQWLVYSSTQHPGEVQHWVSHALGINNHAVRVECRRMGGGFGGKETQAGQLAVWSAVAANKLKCPIKLRLDRDDDFLVTGKRHPFAYDYTVGFDDTGRITGLRLTMVVNCGFSADLSGPVADRAVFHADNAYFLQDVEIASYRCKTNTQSNTAFRGFGGPQGMIVTETIMSDIARTLGLDALDVRKRNLYSDEVVAPMAGASPQTRRDTTHYQMKVEDNILDPLLSKLELTAQYRRRLQAISMWNKGSPIIKRGIAITPVKFGISFTATLFNQAGALVHVYTDGSVMVNHGGTEMGQGLNTKVAQIVADELGVAFGQVQSTASDTSKIPNASATAASAGTDLNARAAQYAARHVRDNIAQFVAGLDHCGAGAVRFSGGQVLTPDNARPFTEVVKLAYANRIQLWSDGFYRTPKIHYDKTTLTGRPFYYFAYGAACTEVAIDTLTGESRVLKVDILHDVGTSINPAIDIGQIEGGFIQGMGWLTTEQLVWNDKGQLGTHAPNTYKIPATGDVPEHFKVDFWPEPNREDNVFGSKAVGEPPLMLAISVFEALRDAVAGARSKSGPVQLTAPATPENVLRALSH